MRRVILTILLLLGITFATYKSLPPILESNNYAYVLVRSIKSGNKVISIATTPKAVGSKVEGILFKIRVPDILLKYKPTLYYSLPMLNVSFEWHENLYGVYLGYPGYPISNLPFNGSGVKVAIIDTGVNISHPLFSKLIQLGKIKGYFVYYNDTTGNCVVEEDPTKFNDIDGHGTHVLGIFYSIAPNSEVYVIKAYNDTDESFPESWLECAIRYAVENLSVDIISMSLARLSILDDCYNDTVCNLVNYYSDNVTFVIAAGNEGDIEWHYNGTNFTVNFTLHGDYINSSDVTFFEFPIWIRSRKGTSYNVTIVDTTNNKVIFRGVRNSTGFYLLEYNGNYSGDIYYYNETSEYLDVLTFGQAEVLGIYPPLYEFIVYNVSGDHSLQAINIGITINSTSELDIYIPRDVSLTPHSNYYTLSTPGVAFESITIGSINSRGELYGHVSEFSSRGPLRWNSSIVKPEVVAPGYYVCVPWYVNNNNYTIYLCMAGTSMATPFVSGIAAIVKQVCPSYTPKEVKEAIIKSAVVAYNLSNYSIYERGYGIVNVSKLINEVLPRLVLNISNETINTTKKFNISLKNVGLMPTKKVFINGTLSSLDANEEIILVKFNKSQAGKYNISLNITGEFVNSPILTNITVYAYSNLSLKNYSYLINNTYMQLNLTLENNADFEPNDCKLILTLDNGSKIVREYSLVNYNVSLNILLNNSAYSGEVSIKCPFNLNKTYRFTTFTLSYSPNYSLFSGAIINITLPENGTVKVNNTNCSIENSRIVCRLHPGNYTLDIYTEGDIEIHRLVSFEILKPNVSISYSIKNTRNQKYYGLNSSLILEIINNDLNFSGYLIINGSSEPITVNHGINNVTKHLDLSEGNHTIEISLNFSNYFFANLTINLTVDKALPSVTTNLTNYYSEDNAYYTNKSSLVIEFNFTDNNYLSYIEINGSQVLNTTEERNKTVTNVSTYDLHYGENIIKYRACDLANNSRIGIIRIIYDNIKPTIAPENITNITAFGEIELEFRAIDDYLKNFTINYTNYMLEGNIIRVALNCTQNITLKLTAVDKAGNVAEKVIRIFCVNKSDVLNILDNETLDAINKSLMRIESFFANETVKINISGFYESPPSETISGNNRIIRREYRINITPTKNVTGKLTISIKIPEGYEFASAILRKPTGEETANYSIEGGYVKITVNLTDPELIATFEKTETISTSTTSAPSGGGSISIAGGSAPVSQEYFNIKVEGNKIIFKRKGIENGTIELNYTYLKNITIIAKEDTGYVEINELNISKVLDIIVYKAYEITPVNCSVILCFERTPVVLFNNKSILENCVKIVKRSQLIFGRYEIKYKPLEEEKIKRERTQIEKNKTGNRTRETQITKEKPKEKGISPIGIIVIIAVITAILVFIFKGLFL